MKRYVVSLLLMTVVMLAATGFKINDSGPDHPTNCFWGIVYIQSGQTVPGVTVTLFFPDGSQEEDVTNKYGEYRFCRPLGGWVPGYYLIATEKCCEKWVYRAGAGNIQTNFVMPCKCR